MKNVIIPAYFSLFLLMACNNNSNNSISSEHQNNSSENISAIDTAFYKQEGIKLAKQMYAGILTHLKKALDEKGYYEAVRYCNERALPITDSLAKNFGIVAKRTSLKLRNPKNAPDSLEKQILQMYTQATNKTPVVIKTKEGIRFFTPIYIAHTCLTCHGKPNTDIPDVTMIALNKLYPNDQAKNYEINEIRGMWSITFPENYQSKLNSSLSKKQ